LKVPGVIYRLGRRPDPWSAPDWASAGPDGTFGNRFDDPDAIYRVLYASSQRLGCFLETLARFRVDIKLLAELAEIEGDDDYFPLGEVPLEWADKRVMGAATAGGEYADICSSEWLSRLRNLLAVQLQKFGLDDLDASVLQQTAPRILTQFVSRIVFSEGLAGIYYRRSMDTILRIGPYSSPFKSSCRIPSAFDPTIQICSEPSNFIR
jgi:hypothetical protein